jgi:hypothetical protein
MNTRTLLAALAAFVVAFLLGWVIYGMVLKGYMDAHTAPKAKEMMKTAPNLIYLLAGNLVFGVFLAWVISRMGANSAMAGFMVGLVLIGLITLSNDLMYYGLADMYTGRMPILVDVVASAILGGIAGAVAGGVLGMGRKPAA